MIDNTKLDELSSRQKEILSLLRKGLTNHEICKTLKISPNTVKVHLTNIYKILEVSNRTEAVSTENIQEIRKKIETKPKEIKTVNDITLVFLPKVPEHTKAYSLYLSVIEAIHQYHIFRITDASEKYIKPSFQIEVSAAENNSDTLHISIKIGGSHEILWTTAVKVESDEVHILAQKSAILLFRNMLLASAKLNYTSRSPVPYWWYASAYSYAKLENRSEESFEISKKMLSPLAEDESYKEFAFYTLATSYYIAIFENWGNVQDNVKKLGEFAQKAMYNAPYSFYSQMIMAMFNITIGNKNEAIAYLKQVIEANPQFVLARTILTQIYMLTGQDKLAMELIDDNMRCIPESALQPTFQAKTFILLLQGKFDECKNFANQILLFNPKAMAIRLCIIACCNILDEAAESEEHRQQLYKYNPNISKKDVERMLKGVDEQKKAFLWNCLQNIFTEK